VAQRSFRGYADYMQTAEFRAGLDRAIQLAKRKRTVLMCAEAVPWRCHRSLIADALLVRKIKVAARKHSRTKFAKVHGKQITYPL
jgi:uncharacterized protein (DUF488 family)